jgi:hypothetical protein
MKTIFIPEKKRPKVEPDRLVVNVRLSNGRIVRDVLYDRQGTLVGLVVGGQEGVRDVEFDFDGKDVDRIRMQTAADTFAPTRFLKEQLGWL